MAFQPRKLVVMGSVAAGLLAASALLYKSAALMMVPSRVEKLEGDSKTFERTQAEMSRRIDSLSFDIQGLKASADSSSRRTDEWQQRMMSVMSELSGSLRSLTSSVESQARENIRVAEQVKNLQVVTDQLQNHDRK